MSQQIWHWQPRGGWIEVICGCMFCGKTEELILRILRAQIAGLKVQVFKHSLDADRYAADKLESHIGLTVDCALAYDSGHILDLVEPDANVVAIDEGQFFDSDFPGVCKTLASTGKRIIVAGLDQNFRGETFGAIGNLMAIAELVKKLWAVCNICGAPATRTQRLINGQPAPYNAPEIDVGAAEKYQARCGICHVVPLTE